jgi:hypothetical protein
MYSKLQWTPFFLAALGFSQMALAQAQPAAYTPMDGHARAQWLLEENLSIAAELDDIAVGAIDTAIKSPKEYGTHWKGFEEHTGLITANFALKSTMEVTLGSFWGEDPRYLPTTGVSMKGRLGHVIKMTFAARNREGHDMPAYSRFIAFPASSFISNAWTPRSQSDTSNALIRVGLGFLGRMGENAWKEFIVPRH